MNNEHEKNLYYMLGNKYINKIKKYKSRSKDLGKALDYILKKHKSKKKKKKKIKKQINKDIDDLTKKFSQL